MGRATAGLSGSVGRFCKAGRCPSQPRRCVSTGGGPTHEHCGQADAAPGACLRVVAAVGGGVWLSATSGVGRPLSAYYLAMKCCRELLALRGCDFSHATAALQQCRWLFAHSNWNCGAMPRNTRQCLPGPDTQLAGWPCSCRGKGAYPRLAIAAVAGDLHGCGQPPSGRAARLGGEVEAAMAERALRAAVRG